MYLVFDVGGTTVKYAYMNNKGEIKERGTFDTQKESAEYFYQSIIDVKNKYNDVLGIALSYPGLVDASLGLAINSSALKPLNDRYICKELSELTNVPVSLENDAKCAALAELWLGSLKDVKDALVMVLGTGIGGAVIINGEIYKGKHFKAGEFGSFISDFNDETLDSISLGATHSAVRLVNKIAEALHIENDGQKVFEYIERKDEVAYPLFKKYCNQLAKVIYNIDYVLDLDRVAIGGGISAQPIVIETLNESFKELRRRYRDDIYDLDIVACTYHNDANIIGALYHHLKEVK